MTPRFRGEAHTRRNRHRVRRRTGSRRIRRQAAQIAVQLLLLLEDAELHEHRNSIIEAEKHLSSFLSAKHTDEESTDLPSRPKEQG